MANVVKKKLKIDGMHCTSCAMNIDFDLEDLEGVQISKTSYAKQETEVEFDEDQVKLDQLLIQVKKTGYIASVKQNE